MKNPLDELFRDPVRGVKWLSYDKFPYERAEDEIELDFMAKAVGYSFILGLSAVQFFSAGGWVVFGIWFLVAYLRRDKE